MGGDVISAVDHARRTAALAAMNEGWAARNEGKLEQALACYAAACESLTPLPSQPDPAWRNSLGTAWLNRAELLLRLGRNDAHSANAEAIRWLTPGLTAEWTPLRRNLAGAWANQVQILGLPGADPTASGWSEIEQALHRCLGLTQAHLYTAPEAIPLALQALRHTAEFLGRDLPRLAGEELARAEARTGQTIQQGLTLYALLPVPSPGADEAATRLLTLGGHLYAQSGREWLVDHFRDTRALWHQRGLGDAWTAAARSALALLNESTARPRIWDARSPAAVKEAETIQAIRHWARSAGLA